jgi:hypothetical protein
VKVKAIFDLIQETNAIKKRAHHRETKTLKNARDRIT